MSDKIGIEEKPILEYCNNIKGNIDSTKRQIKWFVAGIIGWTVASMMWFGTLANQQIKNIKSEKKDLITVCTKDTLNKINKDTINISKNLFKIRKKLN